MPWSHKPMRVVLCQSLFKFTISFKYYIIPLHIWLDLFKAFYDQNFFLTGNIFNKISEFTIILNTIVHIIFHKCICYVSLRMLAIVYLSIFYDLLIMYRWETNKCFRWLKKLHQRISWNIFFILLLYITSSFDISLLFLIFIHSAIFPFSIFRYHMKMILLQLSARNLRYSTFITKHSYINNLSKYRNNRINIKDHILLFHDH